MPSVRDIKRRIRSVTNTQQITRAMQMVAAAKLRKSQDRAIASRPYADKLREVLHRLVGGAEGEFQHPLLQVRPVSRVGLVVFSADRGLCGGYNANIIRRADQDRAEVAASVDPALILVGRKARDYFRRRGRAITREYLDIGDEPNFIQAREMAREVSALYLQGDLDEVHLVYTQFFSPLRQSPVALKILPLAASEDRNAAAVDYIYEPSPAEVLKVLLPRYVEVQFYQALLDAKASEHGARMIAMKSATDNAAEMIESLQLSYNKARQAAITKEILEVVSGANALG